MMSANIVCVQLVDDHAIVRSGFRHLLEEEGGFRVVVESDSAEQAWKDYLAHKPDIVIMDISMPGIGGLEGIKRILSRDPSARILALTMLGSELVGRVMQLGAKGYLSKSSAAHKLVKAVRMIMQGRTYIDVEDGGQFLLDHVNGVSNPFHALSKREFEVLMHFLAEKTVAEISDITCMNSKTVHSHKANILKKLHVSGMVGLTRLAMKFSIIKEE
jgi:two-component system invasion response regulator UvrY